MEVPAPEDEACIPLDLYIMFDQSASMACPVEPGQSCDNASDSRIGVVRAAFDQFLGDPQNSGMGVGIGYFGYFPIGDTSCAPGDYAYAAVPIATLPGNADPISNSLNAVVPTGESPTDAAIEGACDYVRDYHAELPGTKKIILLVTDGVPETPQSDCDPSIESASQAAAECLNGSPRIETYVLAVGQALDNLNAVASAGGTEHAYLIAGGDVTGLVLDALDSIVADAVPACTCGG